ncbi:MAG: trehalose-phosphatase [Acidimicrobiales bacterium]
MVQPSTEPRPDRAVAGLDDAVDRWDVISTRLGDHPTVCLDFDGTLSPLVDIPDAAALADGAAAVLDRLAPLCTLAIISGRGADDVAGRVGARRQYLAGSHGFEIVSPEGRRHDHPDAAATVAVLDEVQRDLTESLADVDGVVVERKRFGLTVHDRMVADHDLDRVRAVASEAGRRPHLRVTHGKRVTELRPDVDWDKGRAVRWLIDQIDADERTIVYVGDDTTDEDALRILGPRDVGVVVADGSHPDAVTAAEFRLDDPAAVVRWLDRLADQLARG